MNKEFLFLFFLICNCSFYDVSCLKWKNSDVQDKPKIEKISNIFIETFQASNKTTNHSYAYLESCNQNNCNYKYGRCISHNTCRCAKTFANLPMKDNSSGNSVCTYERKKQMIAFIFEFFIPFGSSHFYLGNKLMGLMKISFLFFFPLIFIISCCDCCGARNSRGIISKAFLHDRLAVIYIIAILVWMFFDILNIALDRYTDSNGIKMESW